MFLYFSCGPLEQWGSIWMLASGVGLQFMVILWDINIAWTINVQYVVQTYRASRLCFVFLMLWVHVSQLSMLSNNVCLDQDPLWKCAHGWSLLVSSVERWGTHKVESGGKEVVRCCFSKWNLRRLWQIRMVKEEHSGILVPKCFCFCCCSESKVSQSNFTVNTVTVKQTISGWRWGGGGLNFTINCENYKLVMMNNSLQNI